MGELGVVLIVDGSVDGFARGARLLHDGWTTLWAPTASTINRWKSFLTASPVAVVLRFNTWDAASAAMLRSVQAESSAPLIVQMSQLDPSVVTQLHSLGVAKVMPLLCTPAAMDAAMMNATFEIGPAMPSQPLQLAM